MSKNIKHNSIYKKSKIAIIGLGYVGLPLAVEFGKKRNVIGFDINTKRIDELKKGIDSTLETTTDEINTAINLSPILKEPSPNSKSPSKADLKNSPNTPKKKLRTRRKINYGNVTSRVSTRSQTRKTRSSTRKK